MSVRTAQTPHAPLEEHSITAWLSQLQERSAHARAELASARQWAEERRAEGEGPGNHEEVEDYYEILEIARDATLAQIKVRREGSCTLM